MHILCIGMQPRNDISFSFLLKTQSECVCVCIHTCFFYIIYIHVLNDQKVLLCAFCLETFKFPIYFLACLQ